jgi:ribosomal protein S18 acetylase RimI-like enzyme
MPDFRFSFLSEKDLPALHATFLKAFADYLVPIQLDWEQFKAKVKREGIEPTFCVAAYAGEEMAGFILTGLGEWLGRPTAYNAGTGVLPQFRGYNLTRQLYAYMLPKLLQSGVEQCLLEVIQENAAALRSYKAVGLKVTRSLDCFRSRKEELLLEVEEPEGITIAPADILDWNTYRSFWDAAPTWQNTAEAIKRSTDDKVILEARNQQQDLAGYIAFFIANGSIAQLAVDPSWRGTGVATALLREAAKLTLAPALMLINVDTAAAGSIFYLERRHFRKILGQYEMLMPIVASGR